jgi:lipopolysaccharide export LptBFGC system permease protein LptF
MKNNSPYAPKHSFTLNQILILAFGVLLLICFLIVTISNKLRPNESRQTSASAQSGASTVKSVGDEGKLHAGNLSTVTIAVDEAAYSQLDDVLIAKDEYGYQQLQLRGKIFSVENDARVLILENGFAKVRVRFLDGTKKGRDGWIPREWLR